LEAKDSHGQLEIRWDPSAEGVSQATEASLEITDGSAMHVIPLDVSHLQAGTFSYARRSGRVDVRLSLKQAGGRHIDRVASFLGEPPENTEPADDDLRKQRDEFAQEAEKLRIELQNERQHSRSLSKWIEDLHPSQPQPPGQPPAPSGQP
jgi:hypothetical protein